MPDPNQQNLNTDKLNSQKINSNEGNHAENSSKSSDIPEFEHSRSQSKEVIDHLAQPGALEVSEMPESLELEARRHATHESLNKSVSELEQNDNDLFGEEGGIGALLKEANLSKKHLRFCCSGVVLFIIIVFLVWGGFKAFQLSQEENPNKNEDTNNEVEVEVEIEEPDLDDEKSEVANNNLDTDNPSNPDKLSNPIFMEPDLFSGILIGIEEAEVDPATESGELIGESNFETEGLTQVILDLEEMVNVLKVDVNDLLNQSNNRRDTLEDYIANLNYHVYLAEQHVIQLESENADIADEFEIAELRRDEFELRYFEQLNDFDAFGAENSIEQFIIEAEKVVNLRTQFLAREKLIEYLKIADESMTLRAKDVGLNEEALIKGVIVTFIFGSLLMIMNAIHLSIYTRKTEIQIMQLVGAKPGMIRFPFLFEGGLYSMIAVLFSMMLLAVFLKGTDLQSFTQFRDAFQPLVLLITELFAALIIGTLSSFLAITYYLKRTLLLKNS